MTARQQWALVGTGGIARTTVGDLHLTEHVDLVGVASRDPQRAAAFAAEFEVPRAYDSYEQMFDDDDVDVVYIGTPISTHAALAEQALRAGKHVLVEKAFATTADQARSVAATAEEHQRFLMEAMWMRFNPAVVQLLADVADGVIGDVRTMHASFGIPFPPSFNIWRPELGGGSLLDMGVYGLTLAQQLFGAPQQIHAVGDVREDGLDITSSTFLRYGGGRFAHTMTSLSGFLNPAAHIGGTTGFIAVDRPFMSSTDYRIETPRSGEPRQVTFDREGNGYVPMFRAVHQAVADGQLEHPWRPVADTIAVLDVIDEVRRQLPQADPSTAPTTDTKDPIT